MFVVDAEGGGGEEKDLIEGQGRRSRGGGDDWKLLVRWDHATCGPCFC